MTTLLASVAAAAVLLTALAGCAAHLARPAALPAALRAHRLLPGAAVPTAAVAAPAAEGLLGAVGTAALFTGQRTALTLVLAAGAALFTCYAAYSRAALAHAPAGAPCGCAGRQALPLSGWVAGRALALAVLAAAGALLAGPVAAAPPSGAAERTVVLLAAVGCTVLVWSLPAAMHQPAAAHRPAITHGPAAGARPPHTGGVPRWTS
jgi:hypothetical protein